MLKESVVIAMLCLGACTTQQVTTTSADVAAACAVAPLLDAGATVQTQDVVTKACAVSSVVTPIVTPLITQ